MRDCDSWRPSDGDLADRKPQELLRGCPARRARGPSRASPRRWTSSDRRGRPALSDERLPAPTRHVKGCGDVSSRPDSVSKPSSLTSHWQKFLLLVRVVAPAEEVGLGHRPRRGSTSASGLSDVSKFVEHRLDLCGLHRRARTRRAARRSARPPSRSRPPVASCKETSFRVRLQHLEVGCRARLGPCLIGDAFGLGELAHQRSAEPCCLVVFAAQDADAGPLSLVEGVVLLELDSSSPTSGSVRRRA